jgi:very-short-patch-repair endonuclease
MTTVRWKGLAAAQLDLVSQWQLVDDGVPRRWIERRVADGRWRQVLDGVYATNLAPLTAQQTRLATTLTAPGTFLSHASAADEWGMRRWRGRFEVVTRAGSSGPKRFGAVLVCRSTRLDGNTTLHNGIPITTPERTLIDLAAVLKAHELARATREAIRLKRTTPPKLAAVLLRHRGARGTAHLWVLQRTYAPLRLQQARSDAESYAQELIAAAGLPVPEINVDIAGEEADLVWREQRRIVEIDGPQFHLFEDEDARKQQRWEGEHYRVARISSDDVYAEPQKLLALTPRPTPRAGG